MARSQASTLSKRTARSAVTNGRVMPKGIDQRSVWVRRFKDVVALHVSDRGGVDRMSQAEQSLVRCVATLTVELEQMEVKFAESETGASAKALDVTPDLSDYVRSRSNRTRMEFDG